MMAIGIVIEGYDTGKMPGWENGTVGYQTDGNIYDAEHKVHGRPTKGQLLRNNRFRRFIIKYFRSRTIGLNASRESICPSLNWGTSK